jgi:dihydropteroate synthase
MYSRQDNTNFSLTIKGRQWLIDKPVIMGILNLTPDSFYDGGTNSTIDIAMESVKQMLSEGAEIIDIGAMSSRPYSKEISLEEELSRLKNILPELQVQFPNNIFSIDTYRSEVAEFAIKNDISIVNDITAGLKDKRIIELAAESKTPYIAMHMQGNPEQMQSNPRYTNIVEELKKFFEERIELYEKLGLKEVILDVGFGFGKSIEDNYRLLNHLPEFEVFNLPVLVGISRKSMIYKPLDISPAEALTGTTALHFEALQRGANILRVHDVNAAKQVVDLFQLYQSANKPN